MNLLYIQYFMMFMAYFQKRVVCTKFDICFYFMIIVFALLWFFKIYIHIFDISSNQVYSFLLEFLYNIFLDTIISKTEERERKKKTKKNARFNTLYSKANAKRPEKVIHISNSWKYIQIHTDEKIITIFWHCWHLNMRW